MSTENAVLTIYADMLDDLERTRIATENRLRSLRQVKGMEGTPQDERLQAMVTAISELEKGATLELKRALRAHPLGGWVKRTIGIGEKQGARLLASIGDPYVRHVEDEDARPRTVSELWAYCGYAPGQKRQKGQKSNWNPTAKMRAYLVAESCMKSPTSPYREVYEGERDWYQHSTHGDACVRCGPSGKPALAGTPLSDGHKHARALRRVAKEVLKDLWIEARTCHASS